MQVLCINRKIMYNLFLYFNKHDVKQHTYIFCNLSFLINSALTQVADFLLCSFVQPIKLSMIFSTTYYGTHILYNTQSSTRVGQIVCFLSDRCQIDWQVEVVDIWLLKPYVIQAVLVSNVFSIIHIFVFLGYCFVLIQLMSRQFVMYVTT